MPLRWIACLLIVLLAPALPVVADPAFCPPGHAKKGWCDDGRRWHVGDRVPEERIVVIHERDRRGLPRPSNGRVWVEVDDEVLLVALATGLVLDVWRRN